MNRRKILILFASIIVAVSGTLTIVTHAQEDYTVLAPLPGTTDCQNTNLNGTNCQTDLKTYIEGLFPLLIGLAAVATVLRIVYGGFLYMSSDAVMKKEDGKRTIINAIYGLVLVIAAWLILYTINPRLLNVDLSIAPANIATDATAGGTLGTPMSPQDIAESDSIRQKLENAQVQTYRGACDKGQTVGCVNLNGLDEATQTGVINLKNNCGSSCSVTITGGTEAGHSATGGHPTGDSLDLKFDATLSAYIVKNGGTPVQTNLGPIYSVKINNQTVTFLRESDHWHAKFQ